MNFYQKRLEILTFSRSRSIIPSSSSKCLNLISSFLSCVSTNKDTVLLIFFSSFRANCLAFTAAAAKADAAAFFNSASLIAGGTGAVSLTTVVVVVDSVVVVVVVVVMVSPSTFFSSEVSFTFATSDESDFSFASSLLTCSP